MRTAYTPTTSPDPYTQPPSPVRDKLFATSARASASSSTYALDQFDEETWRAYFESNPLSRQPTPPPAQLSPKPSPPMQAPLKPGILQGLPRTMQPLHITPIYYTEDHILQYQLSSDAEGKTSVIFMGNVADMQDAFAERFGSLSGGFPAPQTTGAPAAPTLPNQAMGAPVAPSDASHPGAPQQAKRVDYQGDAVPDQA